MNIKPLVKKDLAHLEPLQPEGWQDIKPSLQFYLANDFCHVVKICKQNTMMGLGAGIVFGKTAWLAHIIVGKEFRRQGLAYKIVAHLLERLSSLGCETISLIATDMGYSIYKRSGFKKQTDYVFFKRETPPAPCEDPDNIISFSSCYQKEVFKLDQAVSGEDRGRILTGKLKTAALYREDGKTTGVFLPELGEGMVIAEDIRAGIVLMKKKYAAEEKAVLPVENKAGIAFLLENNFIEVSRAARMIWGKPLFWQPDKLYSRIAGNLG